MGRVTAVGRDPAGGGSDYNLLVVSRLKEEIHAGLNTGIIGAWALPAASSPQPAWSSAFTMASMIVSNLRVVGQLGTTIGLGCWSTRSSCGRS